MGSESGRGDRGVEVPGRGPSSNGPLLLANLLQRSLQHLSDLLLGASGALPRDAADQTSRSVCD